MLSKWFGRRPYELDTSVSMEVDGVTLHQIIAGRDMPWPRSLWQGPEKESDLKPMQRALGPLGRWVSKFEPVVVKKGTRGGWVPSLDVLETVDGISPWLRSKSMVTHPEARLRGALWLSNTQWKSSGILQAPLDCAWGIYDSVFTGDTTILLGPIRHASEVKLSYAKVHNSTIEGPVDIRSSSVTNTRIRSQAHFFVLSSIVEDCVIENQQHQLDVDHCRLQHSMLVRQATEDPLQLSGSQWSHVEYAEPQHVHARVPQDIQGSQLSYMRCTHRQLSNSTCVHTGPDLLATPPSPNGMPKTDLVFVPIVHNRQTTHFAWYEQQSEKEVCPGKPVAIYDALHQRSVFVQDLADYVDEMKAYGESPTHRQSIATVEWWKWQHVLGIQPPVGEAWHFVNTPSAQVDISTDPSFVGFGPP